MTPRQIATDTVALVVLIAALAALAGMILTTARAIPETLARAEVEFRT